LIFIGEALLKTNKVLDEKTGSGKEKNWISAPSITLPKGEQRTEGMSL
jgi:hypothetical protein